MVSAQRDEVIEDRCLLFYEREALRDIAERNAEVADVGYRLCRGVDPPMGVVAVHQHAARLSDSGRPEARAAAVGGAYIERNTGNAERGVGAAAFDREKARRQREGRNGGHYCGATKRKTAAAIAHVQRPPGSPSAAAVKDVLPMMRLLV